VHIHIVEEDGVQAGGIAAAGAGDAGGRAIAVAAGDSLMDALRLAGVGGIEAECGGCLTCGTCAVVIAPEWRDVLPPADEAEEELISYGMNPGPGTRLSCQIRLDATCDGLTMSIPASQR
jgi:ferredoxin, 2Fe-2S